MTPEQIMDWVRNGTPCLNCGERVEDAINILSDDGIIFQGLCTSEVCRELPPGGNPFLFMLSDDDES